MAGMTKRRRLTIKAAVLLGAIALALPACAESPGAAEDASNYPTRDIKIIHGFDAGSTLDTVSRMAAQYASEEWGVNVDVVNRPGGNTVPANLELLDAEPDGYTLMIHAIGSSSILPNQLGEDLPFDVMDQSFISTISSNTMLFITSPDSPIDSLKELAAKARQDPGSFTWSATGVAEITMRQFFLDAGVDIEDTQGVVQEGSTDAIVLANQGDVDVAIAAVGTAIGPLQDGIIKPLAFGGEKWPTLPNVPAASEVGFPSVKIDSWVGLSGPSGLPDDVVAAWEDLIQQMLDDPQIQKQLDKLASEPYFLDSEEFTAQVESEIDEFSTLYE